MSKTLYAGILSALFLVLLAFVLRTEVRSNRETGASPTPEVSAGPTLPISSFPGEAGDVFIPDLSVAKTLEESGTIEESADPDWSLSSGAYLYIKDGIAKTIQGALPKKDKWRLAYNEENPVDTDGGYYPQNILRLEYKRGFLNYSQEAYFRIVKDNMSDSPNRNQSNGLLFFNRFVDTDNLYYTSLRVDGYADIKKKYKGTYYTLTHEKVFDGPEYNRDAKTSLLPKKVWIGIKSEVKNISNDSVEINFFVDINGTGDWKLVAQGIDDSVKYKSQAFLSGGLVGIRTDFMDVEFRDFKVLKL